MTDCDGTSPTVQLLRAEPAAVSACGRRVPRAIGVSLLVHAFAIVILGLAFAHPGRDAGRSMTTWTSPEQIVWLRKGGNPRGGGGSGDARTEPARKLQAPGRDAVTVPAAAGESPKETPRLDQNFRILAVSMSAGVAALPGVPVSLVSSVSSGPGIGGRGGQGRGLGSGPGDGPGLGPGEGGGTGGEAYQAGGGVVGPRLIKEARPSYTSDAMRAKIQGVVGLEAIVMPDGSVGRVRIVRSLDTTFGLDEEAVAAVRRWRFVPGTLAGRAVPVLVNIELSFTLR